MLLQNINTYMYIYMSSIHNIPGISLQPYKGLQCPQNNKLLYLKNPQKDYFDQ